MHARTFFVLWATLACLSCANLAAGRVEPKPAEKPDAFISVTPLPCKPDPRAGEPAGKPELSDLLPSFPEDGKPCVPTPTCSAGLTDCSGICKNLTSDPNSCGACGRICPSNFTCSDGVCAEQVVPCDTAVRFNGGEGNFTFAVNIGSGGPSFDFTYDADDLPDRFNVFLPNGTQIFSILAGAPGNPSSRCRCSLCANEETFANDVVTLARPEGVTSVQVVVNGYCRNTGWNFLVGCAAPPALP